MVNSFNRRIISSAVYYFPERCALANINVCATHPIVMPIELARDTIDMLKQDQI